MLEVAGCKLTSLDNKCGKPFAFQVEDSHGLTFTLAAQSATDKELWMQMINRSRACHARLQTFAQAPLQSLQEEDSGDEDFHATLPLWFFILLGICSRSENTLSVQVS